MFRVDETPTFKWKVDYSAPDENGERLTQTFTGIFKRMPEDYLNDALFGKEPAAVAPAKAKAAHAKPTRAKSVEDVVREVFIGFEDIQGADGKAWESSAENIDKLLKLAGMATAIFAAFFDSSSQVKTKN